MTESQIGTRPEPHMNDKLHTHATGVAAALNAPCSPAHGAPEQDQQNSGCPACAVAAKNPRTGLYQHGCPNCEARALAQDPRAHKAQSGDPGPLQAAMRTLWQTPEKYRAGRVAVYGWIKKLETR